MLAPYTHYDGPEDSLRSEVKIKADGICGAFQRAGALFDFLNRVVITNELREKGIVLLETFVEVAPNVSILINAMTIERLGNISSTGFETNAQ
jgi:hypothetical protein